MNLLDKFAINSYLFFCNQKEKVKEAFRDETGAVDIVAVVVMIGIAVVVAIAFRAQIVELLGQLFGDIFKKSEGVNDDVSITRPGG